ncbi:MAG: radical SAM protein [Deltaproteobacteria bacterium]|nr:radical SAM protein [Deltaproteobacteria bacterium]
MTHAATGGAAIGPAAAQLLGLAQIEPLHFASFYQRTRLYRGGLKSAPAEVVLDLTQDCPLDCAFCLAGAVRGGGRRIELPQLQALARQLAGIPRILVVGGEPLAHPDLRAALALLRRTAAEVEIITGGATLPLDADKFQQWAETHLRSGPGRLVLTLSVDAWHRRAVGESAFARRIEHALALEAEAHADLQVRFLATDPRLTTAGYVRRDAVAAVLGDLHPGLAERWELRFAQLRADDVFRLGPVVRLGSAQESDAEPLDAGELAFAGEVVLTPRGPNGELLSLRALPATWMDRVPPGLQRQPLDLDKLDRALEQTVVAEVLGFAHLPELRHRWQRWLQGSQPGTLAGELRTAAAVYLADQWPHLRDGWLDQQAAQLLATCAPDLPWTFAVHRPWRRVHLPLLRRLWSLRAADRAVFAQQLVRELVEASLRTLAMPGWPAFVGYAPQPGLLCEQPDAPISLQLVPLDTGLTTPYLGDAWHRPRMVLRAGFEPPDGRPVLAWDGLGSVPWQQGDGERATAEFSTLAARMLQVVPGALGEALWACWVACLRQRAGQWREQGLGDLATAAEASLCAPPTPAADDAETRDDVLHLVAGPRVDGWPVAAAGQKC